MQKDDLPVNHADDHPEIPAGKPNDTQRTFILRVAHPMISPLNRVEQMQEFMIFSNSIPAMVRVIGLCCDSIMSEVGFSDDGFEFACTFYVTVSARYPQKLSDKYVGIAQAGLMRHWCARLALYKDVPIGPTEKL